MYNMSPGTFREMLLPYWQRAKCGWGHLCTLDTYLVFVVVVCSIMYSIYIYISMRVTIMLHNNA